MSKPSPIDALCERWRESVKYCLKESDRLADNHEDLRSERMLTRGRTIEKDCDELSRLAPLVATVVEAFREKSKLLHRTMAYRSSTSPHAGITFEDCTEVECVTARAALKAYEEGA